MNTENELEKWAPVLIVKVLENFNEAIGSENSLM